MKESDTTIISYLNNFKKSRVIIVVLIELHQQINKRMAVLLSSEAMKNSSDGTSTSEYPLYYIYI